MASWRTHNNRKRLQIILSWDSLCPRRLNKRMLLIEKQYMRGPKPLSDFCANVIASWFPQPENPHG
jgi:hypothetical protein